MIVAFCCAVLCVVVSACNAADFAGLRKIAFPKAPFLESQTQPLERLPVRFSIDRASLTVGDYVEFNRELFRLRVFASAEAQVMLYPITVPELPWGVWADRGRTISLTLDEEGNSAQRQLSYVPKGSSNVFDFVQTIVSDAPSRCRVETSVRAGGTNSVGVTGWVVLVEDRHAWKTGTLSLSGAAGRKVFDGKQLSVDAPENLVYETLEPGKSFSVAFPRGLLSKGRVTQESNGIRITLFLAKPCNGIPVSFEYDFGKKRPGRTDGEGVVNGTDFHHDGDLDYAIYDKDGNFLMNPSFESGSRYYFARTGRDEDRHVVFGIAHSGKRSYELNGTVQTFTVPLEPRKTYTLSFYARAIGGKSIVVRPLHCFGGKPPCPSPGEKRFAIPVGSTWIRFAYTFSWPFPMTSFEFRSDGVLLDDLQLEKGDAATPYRGNPFGFVLENDGCDPCFVDASKPADVRLVVRGNPGATGALSLCVEDFFGRETYALASTPLVLGASGEGRVSIPDSAFPKGPNVIQVCFCPQDGDIREIVDYLRLSRFSYANGTARNRMLHQYSSLGGHNREQLDLPESLFRMMKVTGVAPRCRTVQDEKGVYSPELAKAILKRYTDIGGMTFGYVWADSVRSATSLPQFVAKLKERGFPDPKTVSVPSAAFLSAIEEVTAEIVAAAPWADIWIGPDEISESWACAKGDGLAVAKVLMAMQRGVKRGNPEATFISYSMPNNDDRRRKELRNFLEAAKRVDPEFRFEAIDPHPYRNFYEGEGTDVDEDWAKTFALLDECGYPSMPCYCFGGGYAFPFYMPTWNNISPWLLCGFKDAYNALHLPGYDLGWGSRVAAAIQLRYNLVAYKYASRLRTNTNWDPKTLDAQNPISSNIGTAAQTELLGDARFLEDVRFAPACRAYVFDDAHGHATAVFWKYSKAMECGREQCATLAIGLQCLQAEVFDMMANPSTVEFDPQGRMLLPLSNFPVYVRVARSRARELAAAFRDAREVR